VRLANDGPPLFSSNDIVVDVHLIADEYLFDLIGSYAVPGDVPSVDLVPVELGCVHQLLIYTQRMYIANARQDRCGISCCAPQSSLDEIEITVSAHQHGHAAGLRVP
jgi:hypothetical protein